ncbi:hypothetical protein MVEN_00371000 [Mycena venus]|uniref:Uncharacterized protein n=1 Tax=Mycena venus TaxID=2733690 RepID=A0A8H6YW94_9AGAR|nr:hypothetical protein MVEN_00371000 [Mycena venus]
MGVHFYDESPIGPDWQRGRLGPPLSISRAGIPCVVWAEDALAIVHRVPTGLHDLQVLVPDGQVADAANAICTNLPYVTLTGDEPDSHWLDHKLINPDRPHAFILTPKDTLVLKHTDPHLAWEEPSRILVHRASTFHFDITDTSRTMLNPEPLGEVFAAIRFPTVAAFLDAIVDTEHEPPLPFYHTQFYLHLNTCRGYLALYTLSDKGDYFTIDDNNERILLPQFLEVLAQVKEENQPCLARYFLQMKRLPFEDSVMEWRSLKAARLAQLGHQYEPPIATPYSPYLCRRGLPPDTGEPRLTPYLTRGKYGQLSIQWRALPRYASIAAKMLR